MPDQGGKGAGGSAGGNATGNPSDERAAKRAAALRANLRRRKSWQREQAKPTDMAEGEPGEASDGRD